MQLREEEASIKTRKNMQKGRKASGLLSGVQIGRLFLPPPTAAGPVQPLAEQEAPLRDQASGHSYGHFPQAPLGE